jgi:hypothetical protein
MNHLDGIIKILKTSPAMKLVEAVKKMVKDVYLKKLYNIRNTQL